MTNGGLLPPPPRTVVDKILRFCIDNKLVVFLFVAFFAAWGVYVAPFDWNIPGVNRNPVSVDAIPDLGENQQIVFTDWMGRSPQDIENQITYPLSVALRGIPGVKTIRATSMFGFSSIYVIFKEGIEFYWARSRVLEKLNGLPEGTLPEGVRPMLGPDATGLGQVFWYTLEGRDENDNPAGGWDLQELRSVQDWYVRYALLTADGVSEVASVGGFVKEYQIDVDPDAMRAYDVRIDEVAMAVRMANIDVGARTIEVNQVEYTIRGLGFIRSVSDIENSVVKVNGSTPIYVRNVARVALGPAWRGGALDKEGTEAVGGVVVVRYGGNPLVAIKNVKEKIKEIAPSLPKKVLPDGRTSYVRVVPFYDRTGLIHETLGTLNQAIVEEIIVTVIVIVIMAVHLQSSFLISSGLPLTVLVCFIAMKIFKVDANVVALSGIAIAIGTIVDMGIVICENILRHLEEAGPDEDPKDVVFRASSEVGSAVLTAVSTTVVGFLPVFAMEGAEGKLFKPLAFTKTFALIGSIIVALTVIPSFAALLFTGKIKRRTLRWCYYCSLIVLGIVVGIRFVWWAGAIIGALGVYGLIRPALPKNFGKAAVWIVNLAVVIVVLVFLTIDWMPIGVEKGTLKNFIFVAVCIGVMLSLYIVVYFSYSRVLRFCLNHKILFLSIPTITTIFGAMSWLGFDKVFGWLPVRLLELRPVVAVAHAFPGLGKEFMPSLNEGAFLYMPTTMPHASLGESLDALQKQDMSIREIPEVDSVVGKIGRAETALDPAPISMVETVINYKSQFLMDSRGGHLRFKYTNDENDFFRDERGNPLPAPDREPYIVSGKFERDADGGLIRDDKGQPFRLWRAPLDPNLNPGRKAWGGIRRPDDVWDEIVRSAQVPGSTSAPKLQPIETRITMLQSGMRASMGIKVTGSTLEAIEEAGIQMEALLREVPSIRPETVFSERIVAKPYIEIDIDLNAVARYGIKVQDVQDVIEVAVGGKPITTTIEGRERYPVRVRYSRELRDNIESLGKILVPAPGGSQIPITQLADIRFVRGPQMIKSEDTFLVGYVLFDKKPDKAEVDVVESAKAFLNDRIADGRLKLPAGVNYHFAGTYENQIRAMKKLRVVLPLSLFVIFLILYFQFRSVPITTLVFSGIIVSWAGGFILIWLYGQDWFLDFSVYGVDMRELFQVRPINLSVAIWVGFLALFGIASDDGVIMATYQRQVFQERKPSTIAAIREATIIAGRRRIRPCLMTTATTVLALLPVLTSTGRGSDVMVPMAIPGFGGMTIEVMTMFVVPVLYSAIEEFKLRFKI